MIFSNWYLHSQAAKCRTYSALPPKLQSLEILFLFRASCIRSASESRPSSQQFAARTDRRRRSGIQTEEIGPLKDDLAVEIRLLSNKSLTSYYVALYESVRR